MAAEGNQNALGNSGGKSLQDRKLAAEVRKLTLNKIKVILERPVVEMSPSEYDLHNQILLKLAGTVLPRLTEVTGEDGGPMLFTLSSEDKTKLDNLLNGKSLEQSSDAKGGGGK
jgi:hypothetical protein